MLDTEWPTHTAELTRKTTEVLARWTDRYERGEVTKRDYFVLLNGIYDTTIGLIKMDVSDLIADLIKELKGA